MIIRSDNNGYSELTYEGDNFKIKHVERVPDGLLRANYENRKDKNSVKSVDGELWHMARIPTLTYIKWYRQYPELRDSDPKISGDFLKKLLKQPENQVFLTYAAAGL